MEKFNEFLSLVQEVWNTAFYGINVGQLLVGVGILLFFIAIRNLFSHFIVLRIQKFVSRTANEIDDAVIDALETPMRIIPIVLGIFIATSYLSVSGDLDDLISKINRSLIAFTIFWSLYRASTPFSEVLKTMDHVLTDPMINWLSKILKFAFATLGAATILELWGIQVGPLIAGLGLFGVAVALGAQDLFKNLIAGIFLISERRFNPGDWVLIKGVVEGTVETIGFRTTTVRRFDKAPVYVPNAAIADQAVINFSRMTYRRIKWVIGLEYGSTAEQLKTVRQAVEDYITTKSDFVQPEETTAFVHIDRFSDSSIDILLYCFTHTTDWIEWLKIKERLLLHIKDVVESAGTGFAFPSQSLYIEALGETAEAIPTQNRK